MKFKLLSAALAASLLLGGVARAADTPDFLKSPLKKPLSQVTLGLAFDLLNPYSTVYDRTFRAFTSELGVKTVILDSQGDVSRQTANVRDLVAQQVDAVVVMPSNPATIIPALRDAHEAGIPVVLSNSQIDKSGDRYVAAWTGPDHYSIGLQAGELIGEALKGKGQVAIIVGNAGGWASLERERGTRDALAKLPGITIVDVQPSDWKRDKAQTITEAFIARFGKKLNGIVAADDGIALGALSAIEAAAAVGKIDKDQIKVTSGNAFSAGYDAIKAGSNYYGSAIQAPEEDAKAAIRSALKVVEGEPVPPKTFFPTPKFTKDTAAQFPRPAI